MTINEMNAKGGSLFGSMEEGREAIAGADSPSDQDKDRLRQQRALHELFREIKDADLTLDAEQLKQLASIMDRSPRQVEGLLEAMKRFQHGDHAGGSSAMTSVADGEEPPPLDNLFNGDPTMLG